MSKKKTEFPDVLYVSIFDYDDDKPLFSVSEHMDEIDEAEVAVYHLDTIGKIKVTREFEEN